MMEFDMVENNNNSGICITEFYHLGRVDYIVSVEKVQHKKDGFD